MGYRTWALPTANCRLPVSSTDYLSRESFIRHRVAASYGTLRGAHLQDPWLAPAIRYVLENYIGQEAFQLISRFSCLCESLSAPAQIG